MEKKKEGRKEGRKGKKKKNELLAFPLAAFLACLIFECEEREQKEGGSRGNEKRREEITILEN